ncbi:MAG: hypothetical protein C5S45_00470 [Candidatus Methanocomedens sp.]|nr:MAG: hypothetical protein C5S45_00470 [ANME-2 cluster archaeon]
MLGVVRPVSFVGYDGKINSIVGLMTARIQPSSEHHIICGEVE